MDASVLPEATGAGGDEPAAPCGSSIGILGRESAYGGSQEVARPRFRSLFLIFVTAVDDPLIVC